MVTEGIAVKHTILALALGAATAITALSAHAAPISVTGTLATPIDVARIAFSLAAPSSITAQSYGYGGSAGAPGGHNLAGAVIAAGGFDPYLSLFRGSDDAATFLASNDDGACPPGAAGPGGCLDSTLSIASLAAGEYVLVVSLPGNFSFAENYGDGTLGDGFVGLVGDDFTDFAGNPRTGDWAVDIGFGQGAGNGGGNPTPVPEPGSIALIFAGIGATLWRAGRVRSAARSV